MELEHLKEAFQVFTTAAKSLENYYEVLQTRIRELTAELEKKNKKLREMEIQQERNQRLIAMGEMVAKIVHEIRNPLCSIELFSSMLEKELDNRDHKKLAKGISEGINSLNNILTNMSLFSRNPRPNLKDVDLRKIIDDSIFMLSPLIRSRDIRLEETLFECHILGDAELIKQVILNIIINAIQSTPDKGDISVIMRIDNGYIAVDFIDNGEGIDRDNIERIFDPFFSTKDKGTGLGLTIATKIMQAHNGFIKVFSEKGKGSTFSIYFPKKDDK